MRHVYGAEGRVGQIPSPCGLGGETGYTVALIVTTGRGRKDDKGLLFPLPASQDPPWFYLLFRPWFTTLSSRGQECRHRSRPIANTFERPGAPRYRAHALWGSLNHNHKPTWSAADVSQLATSPHTTANSPWASTKTPPSYKAYI